MYAGANMGHPSWSARFGWNLYIVNRNCLATLQDWAVSYFISNRYIRSIFMAFTWQSAGHAFASMFKEVVTVSKKVVVAMGGLQNEAQVIESLTSLVSPQA